MKLLLTGFEPFGGSTINPSEQVVSQLAGQAFAGVSLHTAVLPVDAETGPGTLIDAFDAHRPDAVLCLGEAGRRQAISVERIFVNLLDYGITDNSGKLIANQPIALDGPAAYFATLPVQAIHDAIKAAGIPVTLSLTAGAYLCNQVSYTLLHYLATNRVYIPAGFIHLPFLPQQAVEKRPLPPSMSLDTMIQGIGIAIRTLAKT